MKYDFDSYFFYETIPRASLNIKMKVNLTEHVDGKVLKDSATKAFHRFPYYRRIMRFDETGAHILEPSEEELVVKEEGAERIVLGSEETNHLFFCITWTGSSIYFHAPHSICGGCGMMVWVQATLWQYLTDLYQTEISSEGILTPLTPFSQSETAIPELSKAPADEGELVNDFGNAYMPMDDYEKYFKDPFKDVVFIPIILEQDEVIGHARANHASPNSLFSAIMFKTLGRVFRDRDVSFISSRIVANYRADVGCPDTYRDLVRMLRVKYTPDMLSWSIGKLSAMTREKMFLQLRPELSWLELKRLMAYRAEIDEVHSHEGKMQYAFDHSLIKNAPWDTYTISYVGNLPWGGLADYVESLFFITDGHFIQEITAVPGKFCFSFQQVVKDDKYLKAFLQILDEENLHYEVGNMEEKNLAGIHLGE
ncbi:MAG: hypothetical protein K6C05_06035 [Anaerovibrio sp.]|uniref:hypothetical protein n=1 Tax=Anaerovibrio sp. TaxID=1872532 RepID=UPI0025DE534E|nr:hypothetical protein [Anaerovibrio sp.]MCR5176395.1 hypothetical protein [Anaerovibrio sp.]